MNKSDIIKIAAILVVVFFIFEMFAMGVIGGRSTSTTTVESSELVGSADYVVTLKSFEPYLAIVVINDSQKNEIKTIPGVEGIIASNNGYIVSLKSRDDVRPVYIQLKQLGLLGVTVANIQFPTNLDITLANGSVISIVTGGGLAQMEIEPFASPGEQFAVHSTQLKAQDGILVAYSQPTLSPKTVTFNATVLVEQPLYGLAYIQVPWEARMLDLVPFYAKYGQDNVSYTREDAVPLNTALSTQEMISKKYDYVEFISENSITPYANFSNSTRLAEDFNVSYFPESTLTLVTSVNESVTLAYPAIYRTGYSVQILADEYTLSDPTGEMILQNVSVGGNATIEMTALALGKTISKVLDAKQV